YCSALISLPLDLQPINVVIYYDLIRKSNLVDGFALRCFQRLSLYPTSLPSSAPGGITRSPAFGPSRPSRTQDTPTPTSNAHYRQRPNRPAQHWHTHAC